MNEFWSVYLLLIKNHDRLTNVYIMIFLFILKGLQLISCTTAQKSGIFTNHVVYCPFHFFHIRQTIISGFLWFYIHHKKVLLTKTSYCILMRWHPRRFVGGRGGTYSCSYFQSSVSLDLILPRLTEDSSLVSVWTTLFLDMYWIVCKNTND